MKCIYCKSEKCISYGHWFDNLGHCGNEWYCVACDLAWSEPCGHEQAPLSVGIKG